MPIKGKAESATGSAHGIDRGIASRLASYHVGIAVFFDFWGGAPGAVCCQIEFLGGKAVIRVAAIDSPRSPHLRVSP